MQARDVWIYGTDLYIVNKSMPDLQDRWKALTWLGLLQNYVCLPQFENSWVMEMKVDN